MDKLANVEQAVELLQQLGLKEYEAKSFVALSRLPRGTAKDISDISEVPRTRVYDAIRVLESKGLVEIQHSNPQQFRAVSIDEAVQTLRNEYDERAESLRQTLRGIEPASTDGEADITHEIWALSGNTAITNRAHQLIDGAETEVVLVIGSGSIFTEGLIERLEAARERGLNVLIGTISLESQDRVQEALPDTEVFVSELAWLNRSGLTDDETEISRLLLVDREAILVSTYQESSEGSQSHEQAVIGRGFDNGLVAIVRRILATGLLTKDDPLQENE